MVKQKALLVLSAILGIATIVGLFSLKQANNLKPSPSVSIVPQPSGQQALNLSTSIPATPVFINIPKLGIQTNIEPVGIDSRGRMDVPKNVDNVAWYNLGYKPGEEGNAVLAGHLDDREGKPAVFYNLESLQRGDEVDVVDEDGKVFKFIVTRRAIYDDAKFPIEEVFISSGKAQLVLITCTGTYSPLAKNYSQRIVVYSELI